MRKASFLCAVVFCAHAAISFAALVGGTYTTSAVPGSGWAGSPVYTSLPNAADATSGQGVPAPVDTGGPAGVNYSVLSETFTPQSTIKVDSISIVASGGAAFNNQLRLHLYPVSGGGTNYPSGNPGGNGDNFYFPGTDLLNGGSGAGIGVNFPGFVGTKVVNFDFDGADEVTLSAGQVYAFEIWVPANAPANTFIWDRDGTTVSDPYGQMMGARDGDDFTTSRNSLPALMGASGPRTGALAIYTPEPASLTIIGMIVLALPRRCRI